MALTEPTLASLLTDGLSSVDPEIARLCDAELERQRDQLELIASENFTWPAVIEAVGSVLTNKYAEGYPGKRYYGGCEVVDEVERLAIERAKALFGAEHANVQPHAGAQANMAAYYAVLDTGRHGARPAPRPRRPPHARPQGQLLGPQLPLRRLRRLAARPSASTSTRCARLAQEHRPKLIVTGGSAYPREIDCAALPRDRRRGRRAADGRHGALLGPRRRGPAPEPRRVGRHRHARPRTRRSPGRARASSSAARSSRTKIDRAVFPGLQGGPLCHATAAKAVCFAIAADRGLPRLPARRSRPTPTALAEGLAERAASSCSAAAPTRTSCSSTCAASPFTGKDAEERLHDVAHDGQPQHRALRRAPADGRLRRPHRHAGGDHARPRRRRLPRGRRASSRRPSGARRRPGRRWPRASTRDPAPPPALRRHLRHGYLQRAEG